MSRANSATPRRIALVDCNNFYVSCERVFRPDWQRRPVGVLSNNDGCLIARSNELKQAGIPMGAPYFKYREPLRAMGAVVVSSNYTLYANMSHRVMRVLSDFTPEVEIYSIDEAWLDLTGFEPARLDAYARRIVATTKRATGIPVSLGIGPTKVLAKIANRLCKKRALPGQVFNLGSADDLEAVLASVAVGDVWGIGRRWAEKLAGQGIHTALDLRNADPNAIRERYSVVMQRLVLELRGTPCLGVEEPAPKQEIIASRSFGARVTDEASLVEAVALHATRAGEKLRLQGSVCGALQVTIRSSRHHPHEPYVNRAALVRFEVPTADTRRLIAAAGRAVERLFQPGVRYAKAGVMALDIGPASAVQASLFGPPDSERSRALMATVDRVNRRYGRHTLRFAAEGLCQAWAMKRGHVTPSYTTQWHALPRVQ